VITNLAWPGDQPQQQQEQQTNKQNIFVFYSILFYTAKYPGMVRKVYIVRQPYDDDAAMAYA
jgi:hypothetical protein